MTATGSELDARTDPGRATDPLASAYRLVADCFVYPEDLDRQRFVEAATEAVVPEIAAHVDDRAAALLAAFLDEFDGVSAEEYVRTLELSPACPLYLGHYEFDQPETCRDIADADRNQYMVELAAIYDHFGFALDDELPDYLPAMVEFLALTRDERGDPLREEFVSKMASMLPGMVARFEEEGTPYRKPLAALERVVQYDLAGDAGGGR